MSHKYSGIDISKWQPPSKMNWKAIARNHDFAIIRACYGVKFDWAFADHFKAARENHVLVGAYLFYRQSQGWKEQYDAFKRELDKVVFGEGDILPVVDLEWNERYDGEVDPTKFNIETKFLIEKLTKTYGGCILYIAPGFYQTLGKPTWLLKYPWWIAHHSVNKPWCPWVEWVIWQYTGKGTTPGYSGAEIDLNWANKLPPVVEMIPELDVEGLYVMDTPVTPLVLPDIQTTPDAPISKRGWFQVLMDWLKLWIFSRKN